MTDQEQREVFAKNLVDVLEAQHLTQKEVADAIGVSPQVLNTWCKAIALPRTGKVQRLATHLGVPITRLLDHQIPAESDEPIKYTLTSSEASIIDKYRLLDKNQKERIEERMEEMLAGKKAQDGMEGDVNVG